MFGMLLAMISYVVFYAAICMWLGALHSFILWCCCFGVLCVHFIIIIIDTLHYALYIIANCCVYFISEFSMCYFVTYQYYIMCICGDVFIVCVLYSYAFCMVCSGCLYCGCVRAMMSVMRYVCWCDWLYAYGFRIIVFPPIVIWCLVCMCMLAYHMYVFMFGLVVCLLYEVSSCIMYYCVGLIFLYLQYVCC